MHDNGDTHSRVMAEGKLQHPILQLGLITAEETEICSKILQKFTE